MRFVEVIGHAIKLGWNHKSLWLWQLIPSLSVIFIFPLFLIYYPSIKKVIVGPELQLPLERWVTISSNSIIFLFVLSYLIWGILIQITTLHGVVAINKGELKISFKDFFRKSLSYFWRILALYFLFFSILAVIQLPFVFIVKTIYKYTIPEYSLVFLSLIFLPVICVCAILMELSQSSIIVDNMSLYISISHAWKIFKKKALNSILFMITLYYGASILFGLLLLPFLFILVILVLFLTRLPDANTIVFLIFFVVVPFMAIVATFFNTLATTFFHYSWILAYFKIYRPSELNLQEEK